MPNARSPTLAIRARGPLAVFTEPAFKVERVSYPVMTPSAARGLLEAVLWKPAMRWRIRRVKVLSPIRFVSFRRNEVNHKAPMPPKALVSGGGFPPALYIDGKGVRAQRNTIALRDVDYVIEADVVLTDRAGPEDNLPKFTEMFRRRVEKGQHFHQPYFGCREFAADVSPADEAPRPQPLTRDLGLLLWDVTYESGGCRPEFFQARLVDGVLEVPDRPLGGDGGDA